MYEAIRYPFVITDDAGYAILSYPALSENKKCFFSNENFSPEEIAFLFGRIKEYRPCNLLLLKERKKGRAVFVSPFVFASARTLVAIISDIEYDIAASVCAFSHGDVVISGKADTKLGRKHETVYTAVSNILYSLKDATDIYSHGEDFYKYLGGMVDAVSHMAFCKGIVNFAPEYSVACPDNFDSGILSLYLLVMMSAASYASGERSAEISFSADRDVLCVSVSFSALMDKDLLADFEKNFSPAVSLLDGICAENNLPMYFYRDGVFKSGIIPCRIESGLIGLKARAGGLKDKQQKEQKERNIFLSACVSADE